MLEKGLVGVAAESLKNPGARPNCRKHLAQGELSAVFSAGGNRYEKGLSG